MEDKKKVHLYGCTNCHKVTSTTSEKKLKIKICSVCKDKIAREFIKTFYNKGGGSIVTSK